MESPMPQRPKRPQPTPVPDDLTVPQQRALVAWIQKNYPHLGRRAVRREVDEALDHARATGKEYVDYEAYCRNWIRRSEGFKDQRREARPETPREERPPGRERQMDLVPITEGKVVGMFEEAKRLRAARQQQKVEILGGSEGSRRKAEDF
jgi:hypothetical protein